MEYTRRLYTVTFYKGEESHLAFEVFSDADKAERYAIRNLCFALRSSQEERKAVITYVDKLDPYHLEREYKTITTDEASAYLRSNGIAKLWGNVK